MQGADFSGPWEIPPHLLLTVPEAAESLRMSRTKLYELLCSGELKSIKIGGLRRIRRIDLELYVETLCR